MDTIKRYWWNPDVPLFQPKDGDTDTLMKSRDVEGVLRARDDLARQLERLVATQAEQIKALQEEVIIHTDLMTLVDDKNAEIDQLVKLSNAQAATYRDAIAEQDAEIDRLTKTVEFYAAFKTFGSAARAALKETQGGE